MKCQRSEAGQIGMSGEQNHRPCEGQGSKQRRGKNRNGPARQVFEEYKHDLGSDGPGEKHSGKESGESVPIGKKQGGAEGARRTICSRAWGR